MGELVNMRFGLKVGYFYLANNILLHSEWDLVHKETELNLFCGADVLVRQLVLLVCSTIVYRNL